MASRGRMQARSRVQLVEGRIRWAFACSLRCVVWRQYYILVFLLVEWRINSEVSFICLLLTGDCSRNSKSYRWHLESRQGFENRGMSNALKVERPHSRSEWAIGRWGPCPHKNSWRFLPEFRGRSCDARLFCNRRLIICCLLKQWFQKGHWWFRSDTKKQCEGAVTRHSEAFWSKPGKETRKTDWSSDSIEKKSPVKSFFARSGERRFEG